MEIIMGLIFIVVLFFIALIPSWLVLLAYDYIATQFGWVVLDVTFMNVLCLAVIITIISSIFKSK